jgi:hypothetical protein
MEKLGKNARRAAFAMRGIRLTQSCPEASAERVDLGAHPVTPSRPHMLYMQVIS